MTALDAPVQAPPRTFSERVMRIINKAPVHIALVLPAGMTAYAVALRFGYPAAWHDLSMAVRRVLPRRRSARGSALTAPT